MMPDICDTGHQLTLSWVNTKSGQAERYPGIRLQWSHARV